jgi:hypothetical protein
MQRRSGQSHQIKKVLRANPSGKIYHRGRRAKQRKILVFDFLRALCILCGGRPQGQNHSCDALPGAQSSVRKPDFKDNPAFALLGLIGILSWRVM